VPFSSFISLLVPREHLGHYSDKRKYLPSNLVKEFAKKIYNENGIGITIQDIINEYGLDKKKAAQRKIKHLLEHKILFTAIDLEKEGIKIRGIK
jgi:hypothetical protein